MFFHAERVLFKIFSYSMHLCTYKRNIYIIKIFISTSLNKKILLPIFISFYHTQKHICYFHRTPYERDILDTCVRIYRRCNKHQRQINCTDVRNGTEYREKWTCNYFYAEYVPFSTTRIK